MERWLVYSASQNEEKDPCERGYNLALTDDGKVVRFTQVIKNPRSLDLFFKRYADGVVKAQVTKMRAVRSTQFGDINQKKWAEWGYTPDLH